MEIKWFNQGYVTNIPGHWDSDWMVLFLVDLFSLHHTNLSLLLIVQVPLGMVALGTIKKNDLLETEMADNI